MRYAVILTLALFCAPLARGADADPPKDLEANIPLRMVRPAWTLLLVSLALGIPVAWTIVRGRENDRQRRARAFERELANELLSDPAGPISCRVRCPGAAIPARRVQAGRCAGRPRRAGRGSASRRAPRSRG